MNDPVAITATAENPAATLRAAFDQFNQLGRKRLDAAILLGEILADRKKACGHGNWLKWLEVHFPYGRERAADFLRVFNNRGRVANASTFEEALSLCRAEPEPAPECGRPATFEPPADVAEAATNDPEPDDRGDAYEPPELEDEPGDEPPPQSDEMPQPMHDASRPAGPPSYFTPGGKPIPDDHPHKPLLTKLRALSAAFTQALNDDADHAAVLTQYLSILSKHPHKFPFVLHFGARIDGDESIPARVKFAGLAPLYRFVKDCGTRKRPLSDADVVGLFAKFCGETTEDDE